jgi:hypothetical protein
MLCKSNEKAGLHNGTRYKQIGAADQDEEDGCGADAQGDERLPAELQETMAKR